MRLRFISLHEYPPVLKYPELVATYNSGRQLDFFRTGVDDQYLCWYQNWQQMTGGTSRFPVV